MRPTFWRTWLEIALPSYIVIGLVYLAFHLP